ncbi:MAG: hypothetical protein KJN95_05145 [Gammaproteobacteria bacterium]|nr:hypothetical protein [Gammaproteobacteria bacterium]
MSKSILEIVDLDRYPIRDLDSPTGSEFLAQCRATMRLHGYCSLDGFIRESALAQMVSEVNAILPQSRKHTIRRNVYGSEDDPGLPASHPIRRFQAHHPRQLADDQIPSDSLIQRLYQNDVLTRFVAEVQEKAELYRYADEFQALNIVAIDPGEWHAWHFDYNECTVTLLLQAPEAGGEFVFVPNIRSRDHENYAAVQAFLDGDHSGMINLGRGAGTLTMFRGEYSIHGATEVKGRLPRISAILTYDEVPGRIAEDHINVQIYGERVDRILKAR